jgi:hypothetical protein
VQICRAGAPDDEWTWHGNGPCKFGVILAFKLLTIFFTGYDWLRILVFCILLSVCVDILIEFYPFRVETRSSVEQYSMIHKAVTHTTFPGVINRQA